MPNLKSKSNLIILIVFTLLFLVLFLTQNGILERSFAAGSILTAGLRKIDDSLLPCSPPAGSLVGHLTFNEAELLSREEDNLPEVQLGGHYRPADCAPQQKLAVLVPFRNRTKHLKMFLQHMHPILMRQKRYYSIYVIEQADDLPFNRATLFNIGVQEAIKQDNYDCFILHDIDTLPLNDRLIYKCSEDSTQVLHLAFYQSRYNFTIGNPGYDSGVVAMQRDQFMRMNGFSNCYWGWGAEDDDIKFRVVVYGFRFKHIQDETARFISVGHVGAEPSPERLQVLSKARSRMSSDGLNSLTYKLSGVEVRRLYTRLKATLDQIATKQFCA